MKHPRAVAIRYARGERVKNPDALRKHLDACPECSDLVLFVQKFTNALRPASPRRPGFEPVPGRVNVNPITESSLRDGLMDALLSPVAKEKPFIELLMKFSEVAGRMRKFLKTNVKLKDKEAISLIVAGIPLPKLAQHFGLSHKDTREWVDRLFGELGVVEWDELTSFGRSLELLQFELLPRRRLASAVPKSLQQQEKMP